LAFAAFLVWRYGLALAALALVVFDAYDSYPIKLTQVNIQARILPGNFNACKPSRWVVREKTLFYIDRFQRT